MTTSDPFRWKEQGGFGLEVDTTRSGMIAHEVMYENEVTHLKDRPVFMGEAIPHRRFVILLTLLGGLLAALFLRSFWMQVVEGASYRELAERNRLRREVVQPRRGIIRDAHGRVLAENVPSFDVRAVERLLPTDSGERAELLGKIGRSMGTPVADMENVFASSTDPNESVVLKRDVPYERALAVKILAAQATGIEIAIGSKRRYPASSDTMSLSHILGYVSGITREELDARLAEGYRFVDTVGKTGVEAAYETALRGQPGERLYEVDARHRVTATVGDREAVDGQDLTLTIDLDVQRAAEAALRRGMEIAKVTRGAAVVMNPKDGSILALVSLPAYDNNIFSGAVSSTAYRALIENPNHPLLPRAWAGTYPSGSTAKPVIATAGLAEGVITPNTTVLSVGGLKIGPWFFPDWKPGGHGPTNVRTAIAWSINTFFYHVGGGYDRFVGLGVDRLTDWMRRFGLGAKTGIDVPAEAPGFVPSQAWKEKTKGERWFIGDTYNLSIGQGDLLVTPLQVALFTATIANGGYPVTPHVAMNFQPPTSNSQLRASSTRSHDRIASHEVIQTVRLGMRDTVRYGSGRALANMSVEVAGKTGTAQWRSDKPNHAWFTAFAPFDHPKIVVTVLLEEGEEGSRTAVPVAREILQAWVDKKSKN